MLWHWLIEFWRFKEPSRVGGAWCYQLSKGTEAVGMDVTTGYVGRREDPGPSQDWETRNSEKRHIRRQGNDGVFRMVVEFSYKTFEHPLLEMFGPEVFCFFL